MIDIFDDAYESDLTEEESNKLLLMCGHAVGPQLSPAAQAVRDAVLATYDDSVPKDDHLWALDRASVVASLRAAADQVVPPALEEEFIDRNQALPLTKMVEIRRHLYAIAAELESQ